MLRRRLLFTIVTKKKAVIPAMTTMTMTMTMTMTSGTSTRKSSRDIAILASSTKLHHPPLFLSLQFCLFSSSTSTDSELLVDHNYLYNDDVDYDNINDDETTATNTAATAAAAAAAIEYYHDNDNTDDGSVLQANNNNNNNKLDPSSSYGLEQQRSLTMIATNVNQRCISSRIIGSRRNDEYYE